MTLIAGAGAEQHGKNDAANGHPLSGDVYAAVRDWHGRVGVDIRQYYTDKEGQLKPGFKGLALSPQGWGLLSQALPVGLWLACCAGRLHRGVVLDPTVLLVLMHQACTATHPPQNLCKRLDARTSGDAVELDKNQRASVSEFKGVPGWDWAGR